MVTPPLVPGGTGRPVLRSRGVVPLQVPAAVAHVSDADAARLTVRSHIPSAGSCRANRAPPAATDPLASTCQASRRSPLAPWVSAVGGRIRETAVLATKNTASTMPPCHPVAARIVVPTAQAAQAPPRVNARSRQPRPAITADTRPARISPRDYSPSPWVVSRSTVRIRLRTASGHPCALTFASSIAR